MMKHISIVICLMLLMLSSSCMIDSCSSTYNEYTSLQKPQTHTILFHPNTNFFFKKTTETKTHPPSTPTGDEINITIQAGKKVPGYDGINITVSTTYTYVTYININMTWYFFDGSNATLFLKDFILPYGITYYHGEHTVPSESYIMKLTVQLKQKNILRYGLGGEDFNNHLYMRPYPSKIFKNQG